MSKTLREERSKWEERERMTLVVHFELPNRACCISILVEKEDDTLYYDMIRYFKIADDWVTSCDIKSGSAEDVMRKFADIV